MDNLKKNVILEGIFSVETPDTAGEVLDVKGADISDLQTGKAPLNTEHINPDDADKEDVHKDMDESKKDDFKGFSSIVGRVINAKKIFSDADCDSDLQLRAWKEYHKPMIYGSVEIYDGPDAHQNAQAAASLARMFNKAEGGPQLRLSVEGGTIKREGNYLKQTVIKNMALTMKPANRAATIDIVKDEHAPLVSKSMNNRLRRVHTNPYENQLQWHICNIFPTETVILSGIEQMKTQLADALQNLRKTLTAGGMNAAPGTLTQGSALQPEHQGSQLHKLVKLLGSKPINVGEIKKALPGISDKDAEIVMKRLSRKIPQDSGDGRLIRTNDWEGIVMVKNSKYHVWVKIISCNISVL